MICSSKSGTVSGFLALFSWFGVQNLMENHVISSPQFTFKDSVTNMKSALFPLHEYAIIFVGPSL
jgi:hypothetical protein